MVLELGHVGKQIRNTWKFLEMWCSIRTEKISWTDRVRNEEVLYGVKEKRKMVYTTKTRKAKWVVASCVGTAF
jgi:hypothetical protein